MKWVAPPGNGAVTIREANLAANPLCGFRVCGLETKPRQAVAPAHGGAVFSDCLRGSGCLKFTSLVKNLWPGAWWSVGLGAGR